MLAEQDEDAGELHEAQVIGQPIFVAGNQAAAMLKPGEQAFPLPPPAGPTQGPAVLRLGFAPIALVRGNHFEVLGGQARIQGSAIVGSIPDQPEGESGDEAGGQSGFDEGDFVG